MQSRVDFKEKGKCYQQFGQFGARPKNQPNEILVSV